MQRFDSKVVLVTGAGSGIGAATVRRFASEGATVVLVDRTGDKVREVAAPLDPLKTLVLTADVSNQDQVDKAVEQCIGTFSRLDILVNNAGVARTGNITEATVEDWRTIMSVDLDGVFYCTRAAVPHLKITRGCIVNLSSVSGLGGDWNMSFYNAAKGAVTNFTRSLALELGEFGVRVNAVNPTFTLTGMTEDMASNQQLLAKFIERIPLGRPGEPEDIADAIAFLASNDARFITGVNLPVDGGLGASNGQPKQA